MQTSNFKNTVGSLKRLVGRTFASLEEEEKKFINAELVDAKGEVGVKVSDSRYAARRQIVLS